MSQQISESNRGSSDWTTPKQSRSNVKVTQETVRFQRRNRVRDRQKAIGEEKAMKIMCLMREKEKYSVKRRDDLAEGG